MPLLAVAGPVAGRRLVAAEVDPVGVDVELHGTHRSGPHQNVGEVQDVEARPTDVDQGAVRCDPESRPPHEEPPTERGAPLPGIGARCRRHDLPVVDEQVQVLAHGYDVGAHGDITSPLAHSGRAVLVDHEGGRPGPQRNDGLVVGVVPAVGIGHQEAGVERSDESCGISWRDRSGMGVRATTGDLAARVERGLEELGVHPGHAHHVARVDGVRAGAWSRRPRARRRRGARPATIDPRPQPVGWRTARWAMAPAGAAPRPGVAPSWGRPWACEWSRRRGCHRPSAGGGSTTRSPPRRRWTPHRGHGTTLRPALPWRFPERGW